MKKIIIQTDSEDRLELEKFKQEYPNTCYFVDSNRFSGAEVVQLLIENAPEIISAVVSLISILKKKSDEKNIVIILEGGKKLLNPEEKDVKELFDDNKGSNENSQK